MEGDVKNIVPVSKLLEWFTISVQTLFNFTFSDVVKLCDACIALTWNVVLFLSTACKECTILKLFSYSLHFLYVMSYSTVTIASASLEKPEFKCLALGYPADRPMNLRFLGHQSLTTILPITNPLQKHANKKKPSQEQSQQVWTVQNWKQVPYCPVSPWLNRQN